MEYTNRNKPVGNKVYIRLTLVAMLLSIQTAHLRAQTYVSAPMTGTPVPGSYYSSSSIQLSPGFSFTATSNGSLYIYINPDCTPLGTAQTNAQNYIMTSTPRVSGITNIGGLQGRNTCQLMQSVQYFDGLGRPLQTVQVKGSPQAFDIVQPVAYDQFGREVQKFVPYTATTADGSYKTDALTVGAGVANFYNPGGNGTSGVQQSNGIVVNPNPYSLAVFEPSPLNRVVEQGAPGTDWQPVSGTTAGHTVKTIYGTNDAPSLSAGSKHWARLYTVTVNSDQSRALADAGSAGYTQNQLQLNVLQDQNWVNGQPDNRLHTTETYTDKEGHVVLKRTFNYNAASVLEVLPTYYVYDDLGNLAFVLPPGASPDNGLSSAANQTTLDNLCYQYQYDERNRLSQKKLPGKGWEYAVYNQLNKPVLSQDANQRVTNQWTVTKYDAQGRVVVTGLWNAGSAIAASTLQTSIYAGAQWDTRDNTNNTAVNPTGYVLNSYPTLSAVLAINYYDDYTASNLPVKYVASGNSTMTTGLLTVTKTAVLNTITNATPDMLWTVHYYDDLGRDAQSFSQHYYNGSANLNVNNYDLVTASYNFNNQPTATTRKHYNTTNTSAQVVTIANTYVYDHMGRKTQTLENINNTSNILLSQEDYNEIGQLKTKHLHGASGSAPFLQDIAYAYNERGWMTTLNTSTNLFSLDLRYNNPHAGISKQYNGNISEMGYLTTKVANPGLRSFSYTYDQLDRLTNAAFTGGQSGDALNEQLTYDLMGNITQLIRGGNGGGTLNYTSYTGNQLNTVTGYSSRSYGYDANGNATSDGTTKTIQYNLLNLPQAVTQGGTTLATYTYVATGQKLRNTSSDGSWDYISDIVYHNGAIAFIQTDDGRAVNNSGTYHYEYNLQDHLGNNRVSIDAYNNSPRVIQEDEYYSFGLRKPTGGYDLSNNNRYLYNGKELQIDLTNQYDYGARLYDPVIARWQVVDPLAEISRRWSPYNYVENNPIRFTDPDGMYRETHGEIEADEARWASNKLGFEEAKNGGVAGSNGSSGGSGGPKEEDKDQQQPGNKNNGQGEKTDDSHYVKRGDVTWQTIYDEWKAGKGPEFTMIEGGGSPMVRDLAGSRIEKIGFQEFMNAGGSRPIKQLDVKWGVLNVLTTANMTEQFLGGVRISVIPAGNGMLKFIVDNTTNRTSYYLHTNVANYSREKFGRIPESTIYQRIIWYRKISDLH